MIYYKLTTSNTVDLLNEKYGRFDLGTTMTFYKDSKIIGFADYFIINKALYLKNFRVTKFKHKFGSLIIHHMFNNMHIESIYGYSINNAASCFWISLGAIFQKTLEDEFILYNNNLKNN